MSESQAANELEVAKAKVLRVYPLAALYHTNRLRMSLDGSNAVQTFESEICDSNDDEIVYGVGTDEHTAWLDAASRLPKDAGVEEPAKATENKFRCKACNRPLTWSGRPIAYRDNTDFNSDICPGTGMRPHQATLVSAEEQLEEQRIVIHDLETNCDPAGNLQQIASLKEQVGGLLAKLRQPNNGFISMDEAITPLGDVREVLPVGAGENVGLLKRPERKAYPAHGSGFIVFYPQAETDAYMDSLERQLLAARKEIADLEKHYQDYKGLITKCLGAGITFQGDDDPLTNERAEEAEAALAEKERSLEYARHFFRSPASFSHSEFQAVANKVFKSENYTGLVPHLDERCAAEERAQKAEAALAAMTEDRNLWQQAHDEDCPNKSALAQRDEEIAGRHQSYEYAADVEEQFYLACNAPICEKCSKRCAAHSMAWIIAEFAKRDEEIAKLKDEFFTDELFTQQDINEAYADGKKNASAPQFTFVNAEGGRATVLVEDAQRMFHGLLVENANLKIARAK